MHNAEGVQILYVSLVKLCINFMSILLCLILCRLAVGTALGFGVVDYGQKKSVFEKCTLGPAGMNIQFSFLSDKVAQIK